MDLMDYLGTTGGQLVDGFFLLQEIPYDRPENKIERKCII